MSWFQRRLSGQVTTILWPTHHPGVAKLDGSTRRKVLVVFFLYATRSSIRTSPLRQSLLGYMMRQDTGRRKMKLVDARKEMKVLEASNIAFQTYTKCLDSCSHLLRYRTFIVQSADTPCQSICNVTYLSWKPALGTQPRFALYHSLGRFDVPAQACPVSGRPESVRSHLPGSVDKGLAKMSVMLHPLIRHVKEVANLDASRDLYDAMVLDPPKGWHRGHVPCLYAYSTAWRNCHEVLTVVF